MKLFLVSAVVFLSSAIRADILDRINGCERAGGGACVFNLLREIARSSGPIANINLLGGAYRQTTSSALCIDQFVTPVYSNGTLSALRIGWCGSTFNVEYPCAGNVCGVTGVTFTLLSSDRYHFINEQNNAAEFSYVGVNLVAEPGTNLETKAAAGQ